MPITLKNLMFLVGFYLLLLAISWNVSRMVLGLVLIGLLPAILELLFAYRKKSILWKLRNAGIWSYVMPILVVGIWSIRDPNNVVEKLIVLLCFLAHTVGFDIAFSKKENKH